MPIPRVTPMDGHKELPLSSSDEGASISMDAERALRIVSALADGCDPATGEIMGGDHVLQQPDVVRALAAAVAALNCQTGAQEREGGRPARVGHAWTPDEDEMLLSAFDRGTAVGKLAAEHERTRGAIQSRLVKLGRLDPVSRTSPAASSGD